MSFLLILLANCLYIQAIWFGVVSDEATELKTNPFNVKRSKTISIILHLIVCEYIHLAFGQSWASFVIAMLFAVHPITVQVSCCKVGQYYGLNALIFLIALAFAPYSSPVLLLGMGGIGSLIFAPLAFLFSKYWYLSLFCPVLVLLSYKQILANVKSKKKGGDFSAPLPENYTFHQWHWNNLIIVVKTFGYYSLSCLLPIKNGFYNSFLASRGTSNKVTYYWYSFNKHFWGGIFAMVLMVVIWWFNKFNFIGMGIMLFVLSLIPFLNFITVQQSTAPRYAYLSLIGFQVAFVGLVIQLPFYIQTAIFGALFLFYLDRTIRVMKHYEKDNITMIDLDSQVFPDNPRVWYFKYEHMLHKNNPVMAWAEATYGLKHLPEDCQLWFGLACASFELGDMNAANEFLKTCERFMMLTERKNERVQNMQELVMELRGRIKDKLTEKYIKTQLPRRF